MQEKAGASVYTVVKLFPFRMLPGNVQFCLVSVGSPLRGRECAVLCCVGVGQRAAACQCTASVLQTLPPFIDSENYSRMLCGVMLCNKLLSLLCDQRNLCCEWNRSIIYWPSIVCNISARKIIITAKSLKPRERVLIYPVHTCVFSSILFSGLRSMIKANQNRTEKAISE